MVNDGFAKIHSESHILNGLSPYSEIIKETKIIKVICRRKYCRASKTWVINGRVTRPLHPSPVIGRALSTTSVNGLSKYQQVWQVGGTVSLTQKGSDKFSTTYRGKCRIFLDGIASDQNPITRQPSRQASTLGYF